MTQWVKRGGNAGLTVLAVMVAALPCWAVANDTVPLKTDAGIDIVIGTRGARAGQDVSVPVTLQANGQRPSAITMSIRFDSTKLTFLRVDDGAAAVAAGRRVDSLQILPGTLNIVIFGFTDDVMVDGVLFNAVFHVGYSVEQGTLPLTCPTTMLSKPSSSTPEGDLILVFPTDGAVEVGCNGPLAPDLTGSFDPQTGVTLTWTGVSGASAYQVYRATTNDVTVAEAVSDWLAPTTDQYVDASLLANIADYCRLYYWVRARNADECAGDASEPVDFAINTIPAAPTGLTATQGSSDGILLTWNVTPDATDYRVYRSTSTDPATRQPLTEWLPATYSYSDATTAAAQYGIAAGCSGRQVLDVFEYTYWVVARGANGCESDPSASAQGYRGLPEASAASVLPSEVGDALLWLAAAAFLALCRLARKARRV